MSDYLAGHKAGKADGNSGRDWADNTGKSAFYKDGYSKGYLA